MENPRLDQRLWTGYRDRRPSAASVGLIRTGPVDFPWRWPQSVRRGFSHIWQPAVSVLVSIVDVRYGAAPFGKAPVERDCDPRGYSCTPISRLVKRALVGHWSCRRHAG